jgi:flagellar hook-basal body complex protein FliE
MSIVPIGKLGSLPMNPAQGITQPGGKGNGQNFGDMLKGALDQVNNLQKSADASAVQVATGQGGDLHTAMVSMEEASLALQLTLQVRNKLTDAYQEVMRMQV